METVDALTRMQSGGPLPSDPVFATGKINVKDDELDAMLKEASGPINFTMFLNMFGEKLSGEPMAAKHAAPPSARTSARLA